MGNFNVIFAASGTGGHLFPALFIADAIKQIKPDSVIHFIGSGRPLEKQILGKSGYKHYKVMAVQIKNQGLLALVVFSLLLPFLLIYCLIIYLRFKPKVVIGVGGYASVVPVLAAYFLRIPIWLHEAEHNPGLANKFLAKFASKISLVHKNTSFKDKDKCI
ncbi:MAG: glycosyltransferase, partial [Bdellovibrionales bacterium]|nr:glycosyltransferase [Bdellovibrionales bacterium]